MRFKRVWSLVLCLWIMICSSLIGTMAVTTEPSQIKSTLIGSTVADVDVGALKTTVIGSVQGVSTVTRVKIKLELQKKSGESYSTIKTWEEMFYSNEATKTESKLTSPLNTYRLKATFTAYTNTSSETRVVYAYDNK